MTLEAALVAPALVLVVLAVLAVLGPVRDVLAAEEAARVAARAVAVAGDPGAGTRAVATALPGATAEVAVRDGLAVVEVRLDRTLLGTTSTVTGRAVAPLEPAAAP